MENKKLAIKSQIPIWLARNDDFLASSISIDPLDSRPSTRLPTLHSRTLLRCSYDKFYWVSCLVALLLRGPILLFALTALNLVCLCLCPCLLLRVTIQTIVA
jgi:hypothetical protein